MLRASPARLFIALSLTLSLAFFATVAWGQTELAPAQDISVSDSPETDAAIAKRIRGIIRNLDGYQNVTVEVDAGVVRLRGQVLDATALAELNDIVGRIEGVVDIRAEISETTNLRERLTPVFARANARVQQAISYVPLLAIAAICATMVYWLGGRIARMRQPWDRITPNPFIAGILRQIIRVAFAAFALVVFLDILGATALLSTVLGAAGIVGIAIGFAVRDTVENFIASILLSLRQPFRPNDLIEIDGSTGRVIRLTSRATTLLSEDGNHIRIPNATVFKAKIVNYTRNPERRFFFDLVVDPKAPLSELQDLGLSTLSSMPFVLSEPGPAVWIENIGKETATMRFSAWVTQRGTDFHLARGEALRTMMKTIEAHRQDHPQDGNSSPTEGAQSARQKPEAGAAVPPAVNIGPDKGFDRLVAASQNDGDENLLSDDAPQE